MALIYPPLPEPVITDPKSARLTRPWTLFMNEMVNDLSDQNNSIAAILVELANLTALTSHMPRVLASDAQFRGNAAGSVPTVVYNFIVPANTLKANNETLRAVLRGTWSANADTKLIQIAFGGLPINQFGPAAVNGGTWYEDLVITRVTNTIGIGVPFTSTNTPAGTIVTQANVGATLNPIDWTVPQSLTVTLTAPTINDIVTNAGVLIYQPNP
jgi:hypothetical protein